MNAKVNAKGDVVVCVERKCAHQGVQGRADMTAELQDIAKEGARNGKRPSQINIDLSRSHPNALITKAQVHYCWLKEMKSKFRKSSDPKQSALSLLEERSELRVLWKSGEGEPFGRHLHQDLRRRLLTSPT